MKRSKRWTVGVLLGFIFAGAVLIFAFSATRAPTPEDTLEAEIDHWANTGLLEWQAALMDPTRLGLAYSHPETAARYAVKHLEKTESKSEFAWWLLVNIAMPEQRELLEPFALAAADSEDSAERRYQGLVLLLRIASPAAPEKVRAYIEGNNPVHLRIDLIRQLATFLTDESVSLTEQLVKAHAQILAPEIQAEIRSKIKDFQVVSSTIRKSLPDNRQKQIIALHTAAILAEPSASLESRGRAGQIEAKLGSLETRDLFRRISASLSDAVKAGKLEASL
ncbi:MAG TPA: hypothetical protein VF268_04560 [Gammaproteobacteria bacterium]